MRREGPRNQRPLLGHSTVTSLRRSTLPFFPTIITIITTAVVAFGSQICDEYIFSSFSSPFAARVMVGSVAVGEGNAMLYRPFVLWD